MGEDAPPPVRADQSDATGGVRAWWGGVDMGVVMP